MCGKAFPLAVIVVAVSVLCTNGSAEEQADLRLAILDVARIFQEAAAIKTMQASIRSAHDSAAQETKAEEDALRKTEEELVRKQVVLSPDALKAERELLQKRLAVFMELVQERRRSLDLARQQVIDRVQSELNRIVTEIANERGITLILRKEQTVLVATDFDITDEVLGRLNADLPVIDLGVSEN